MIGESFIRHKTFRGTGSWVSLADNACDWANININAKRIVGISLTLCHYDESGMINIYYDEGMNSDILGQTGSLVLSYQLFRSKASWENHQAGTQEKINSIAKRGQIIAVTNEQVNGQHDQALTIVWYRRIK